MLILFYNQIVWLLKTVFMSKNNSKHLFKRRPVDDFDMSCILEEHVDELQFISKPSSLNTFLFYYNLL